MTAGRAGAVMLLHGHGRRGASLRRLDRALRRAGYATMVPVYPYRRPLAETAAHLEPRLLVFAARSGMPVHVVSHSLGGLVTRALMARLPVGTIGRAVMLGPPHGGSEWADLLIRLRLDRLFLGPIAAHLRTARAPADEALLGGAGHEIGVIAGDRSLDPVFPRLLVPRPNDGKVSVAATRLNGATDHLVLPVSHTLMVYDRRVAQQVLAFLRHGRFARLDDDIAQ